MDKVTLYIVLGAVLVLMVGSFFGGRATVHPSSILTVDTIYTTKHDTVKSYITITQKGKIISKTDTILYENTAQIEALLTMIANMQSTSQSTVENPVKPVYTQTGGFGVGVVGGGMYSINDSKITPVVAISVELGKNRIQPIAGYGDGWKFGAMYLRKF